MLHNGLVGVYIFITDIRRTKMINKLFQRLICFLVVSAMLASGMVAMASDVPTPYYDSTASISAGLSISSSGLASCSGRIRLSESSCYANLTLQLQKYTSNGWSPVYTWTQSNATSISGSRYVTSGYNYRVICSANVYTSSGTYVESPSATSSTVYY